MATQKTASPAKTKSSTKTAVSRRKRGSSKRGDPGAEVFISHKTADTALATALAEFIENASNGKVTAFVSSNPAFRGPAAGGQLTDELKKALWRCQVLVLLYTGLGQDWEYCMWECGVAALPSTTPSRTIVLQFDDAVPGPLEPLVRIDPLTDAGAKKFVKDFLTNPKFLPSYNRAVFPSATDKRIAELADTLKNDLKRALRRETPDEEFRTCPQLTLSCPLDKAQQFCDTGGDAQSFVQDLLVERADEGALSLFARNASVTGVTKFGSLVGSWERRRKMPPQEWITSIAGQIKTAVKNEAAPVRPCFVEAAGQRVFIPAVGGLIKSEKRSLYEIGIDFIETEDFTLSCVKEVMIKKFFSRQENWARPKTLAEIIKLMEESGNRGRLPLLRPDESAAFVIHRSMVDRFISSRALEQPGSSVASITVNDLLDDEQMRRLFESFVTVAGSATIAEAQQKSRATKGCQDVFVTETGSNTEPAVGYLTNNELYGSAPAAGLGEA